ncbi:PilW family protein [Roseateles sp. SL47]|uniref:PilW family protein n=1 Tax=Roseateles sp. SL47 TaxID=2995138 RepID=UPI00226FDB35|nr:PilW family protein [Roseateles sp. SL47]WAC73254.1 PilW family protein [Roseateles sp. SL47]
MIQHRHLSPRPGPGRARGFSLVELMVSLVIGMGLIVTMGLLSNKFETSKRESTASSDLSSTAAFLSYDFDRQIRSAGSGFTTGYDDTFGCELTASKSSTQILPAPAALPDPFASVPQSIRLVPLAVFPVAASNTTGSDVIQIMTGTGGVGEVPNQVRSKSVQTNMLRLTSSVGVQSNDLLLIAEKGRPCMLEQVSGSYSASSDQVDLAGTYYAAVINGQALNDRATGSSVNAKAFGLGNASNNNPPRFNLLGVNSSNQLVRYDLLGFTNGGTGATQPVPLADGVMIMRTLYGVDTNGDGLIDSWVRPGTTGYTASDVTTNAAITRQIIAVKVAMVLRSETVEDKATTTAQSTTRSTFDVAPATLTLFSSQASALQTTYTVTDRQRRHIVVEFTVPLRNLLASLRTTPPT